MTIAATFCFAAPSTGWTRSTTGLEVLEGLIVAFLNLDRVIDIIRYDEDPKAALMAEDWDREFPRALDETDYIGPKALGLEPDPALSEVQVEAILNMRLRSLRRLEEMELLREKEALEAERDDLRDLLSSEDRQWKRIADELRDVKKNFGKDAALSARRTRFGEAGEVEEVPLEAMIPKEPITVVCSAMGWIRAMKGHVDARDRAEIQGWRRRAVPVPRPDHRQADPVWRRTGGSTRFRPALCPAGAAWASPCA